MGLHKLHVELNPGVRSLDLYICKRVGLPKHALSGVESSSEER